LMRACCCKGSMPRSTPSRNRETRAERTSRFCSKTCRRWCWANCTGKRRYRPPRAAAVNTRFTPMRQSSSQAWGSGSGARRSRRRDRFLEQEGRTGIVRGPGTGREGGAPARTRDPCPCKRRSRGAIETPSSGRGTCPSLTDMGRAEVREVDLGVTGEGKQSGDERPPLLLGSAARAY